MSLKKKKKQLVAAALAALVTASVSLPTVVAYAPRVEAAETQPETSGNCGAEGNENSVTWSFENGVLTISGTGPMMDWESQEGIDAPPWWNYWEDPYTITEVVIESGVTSIGNGAFFDQGDLTRITISDSVTSIGDYAFWGCAGLTNITIPDSVTSIGKSTFQGCKGLTSIAIPDSVTSIGNGAFVDCQGLTDIKVGENNSSYTSENGILFDKNKTKIIQYPNAKTDTEYRIPDYVTSIGDQAFDCCFNLTSITVPDNVTSIGDHAFGNCLKLTSITIPDSVTSIGEGTFWNCRSLPSITIPDSVTSIGDWAFYCCFDLTSITIPDSVTSIGARAFEQCFDLTSITIPDGVNSIGEWTFTNCEGLTSIAIPDSVTSIEEGAFWYCNNLTDIYYSGSKEQWNKIKINHESNDVLTKATIHYNATGIAGVYSIEIDDSTLPFAVETTRDTIQLTGENIDHDSLLTQGTAAPLTAKVKVPQGVKKLTWTVTEVVPEGSDKTPAPVTGDVTKFTEIQNSGKYAQIAIPVYDAENKKFPEQTLKLQYFGDEAGTQQIKNQTYQIKPDCTVTVAQTVTVNNNEAKVDAETITNAAKDLEGSDVATLELAVTETSAEAVKVTLNQDALTQISGAFQDNEKLKNVVVSVKDGSNHVKYSWAYKSDTVPTSTENLDLTVALMKDTATPGTDKVAVALKVGSTDNQTLGKGNGAILKVYVSNAATGRFDIFKDGQATGNTTEVQLETDPQVISAYLPASASPRNAVLSARAGTESKKYVLLNIQTSGQYELKPLIQQAPAALTAANVALSGRNVILVTNIPDGVTHIAFRTGGKEVAVEEVKDGKVTFTGNYSTAYQVIARNNDNTTNKDSEPYTITTKSRKTTSTGSSSSESSGGSSTTKPTTPATPTTPTQPTTPTTPSTNKVALDTQTVAVRRGANYQFLVKGNNDTANIQVRSANPSIATVSLDDANDARGAKYRVTAVGTGTTQILVTYQGKTSTMTVHVQAFKGSITLDTANYIMAPGNRYDIGAWIRDENGNELHGEQILRLIADGRLTVSDSRTGSIIDLEQLPNGNFRVTGKNEGTAYIIYEIDGTHASVRVDVQKGINQHGTAVRNTSYFTE